MKLKNGEKKIDVKSIAAMGMMIALEIILSRFFSISAWNIKIGFAFIPLAMAGMTLGPVKAGIVAAAADFLGATLFPIGPYFPGFTLSAFITGFVWGIFLYKKVETKRIIGAALINNFLVSMLLSTLWISILYGSPFLGVLVPRIFQNIASFFMEVLTVRGLYEILFKRLKRMYDGPAMD